MSLVNAVKLKCVAFAALPLLPTQVSQCERKRRQSRGQVRYAFNVNSSKSVEVEREEKIEIVEEILSGEWPESLSILNFEDLSAYYEPLVFKARAQPSTLLLEVMSEHVYTATPEQSLEEIDHHFAKISGLPIINKEMKCIGVLSKKDKRKASNGLKSRVGEVMSSPVITLSVDKTVLGIVTRTDIFNALEGVYV